MTTNASSRTSLLHTALNMAVALPLLMSPVHADILRGGGGSGNAPSAASPTPSGGSTPSVVNQARTNAQDSLARTSQALAAVRAMQAAARNNAIKGGNNLGNLPGTGTPLPNVPNGLGTNGLQIHRDQDGNITGWQGAELPTQTTNGDQTNVTIKQTSQQALLTWESFNVGKETTLNFDQSAGGSSASQWIAFNKVIGTVNPTQILGTIKAQGQVYVINQNGIIFGGSSQVNTGALTASALPINDELVATGLLNNPNQAFLFNGLGQERIGDVTVQAGALIKTSVSADGNGGRIFLTGANVTNSGTLSSPAGQVILAAGLQVGVAAHNSNDPSLRGLDAYVGAVVDPASTLSPYAGTVTNNGLIEIARASALLTGKTIQQNGAIDSTTSVSLNGRVDLLANYGAVGNPGYVASNPNTGSAFAWRSTGNIVLGEDSVIRILPETTNTTKSIGTELALRSQINLQGKNIHHAAGSILLAPNAKASIQAGTWAFLDSPTLPTSTFVATGGQVYLDTGSVINLAGTTDATASVLQNIIELELRGSELSVAPVQRDGELRGETIVVDLGTTGTYEGREWVGTPLADLIGYLGLVQRDVAQLTTAGGTLTISAGDSAVLREGSVIDVSGGWTNYSGGTVATTRVVSNGQIVDISQATPDQVYSGIYTGNSSVVHSKWGVVEKFNRALAPAGTRYQEGYTQVASAGSVTITAPGMALDGTLRGSSVAGGNQIRNAPGSSKLPDSGKLTLHFRGTENLAPNYFTTFPDALDIVFKERLEQEEVPDFTLDADGNAADLPDSRKSQVFLSTDLLASSGFGHLAVTNEDGTITVAEGQHLKAAPGGSIALTASNIDILGNVTAAGGSLSFTALNISPYDATVGLSQNPPVVPPVRPGRGIFTLAESVTLSTAGLITDDRYATSYNTPAIPDGGSIRIEAYLADLGSGSLVDVSGGYAMNSDGKGRYGNAGSISILTGKDANVSSALGGTLSLGGTLRGISGAKGGTLTLQAGAIQVGGATGPGGVYHLDPAFFNGGGFTKFTIQGLGGPGLTAVSVASGTLIEPVAKRLAVVANAPGGGLLLGDYREIHGRDPEVSERQAVSLSFLSEGVRDAATGLLLHRGDVVIGENSVIRTDPGAAVEVRGSTATVLGSILAPAGTIRVSGSSNSGNVFGDPNQALTTTFLGANSVLSTAGTVVLKADAYGRRIGSVLGGGSISVSGNLVAAAGAVLDVSGTSGILDVDPAFVNHPAAPVPTTGLNSKPRVNQTVPVRVDSNAGSITLSGGQFLFSDATLRGNAGGASAAGGTLSVSSNRFYGIADTPSPSDVTLTITQSGPVLSGPASNNPIGQTVTGTLGSGHGFFAIDSFQGGGFDSLSLGGVLKTSGAVTIDARGQVTLGNQGIVFNDSALTVKAGAVSLGMPFRAPQLPTEETSPIVFNGSPFLIPATYGSGTLDIDAGHIDVGSLSLQGIGRANLVAENGDVRGNGTFIMAGDLTIRAGQIFPTTASEFNLIAYDYQNASGAHKGSIVITSSGTRSLPYSAGGKLGIFASTIHQGGVLRAPFGTITLGWDGSGTAPRDWFTGNSKPFPVTTDLTLASGSTTSVSGVDPRTGKGLVLPYGYSPDGTVWIDPRGVDITAGGLPEKSVTLSGGNVTQEAGSTIDLRGGGDLYADRWVSGLGGPVDILTNSNSFAIIPSYGADYAPYAAYNNSTSEANLIQGAAGYTNSTLAVGDRIYLKGSRTLAAGWYTLLPARYALLPDAVLVSASTAGGYGTLQVPGGASIVNGYRFNSLDPGRTAPAVTTRFEVASSRVVRQRAQYFDFLANTFIKQSAATLNAPVPVLPTDSGYLRSQATQSMHLAGAVASQSVSGGRGAAIDISTQLDTFISNGTTTGGPGSITLDSAALNAFGAESLLIGGIRTRGTDGTSTVTVTSGKITVDNDGSPLGAEDLILAAKNELILAAGAELVSTGDGKSSTDTLRITGDGALVRVSGNPTATVIRAGTSSSSVPVLSIGAGASIHGGGIILDSTARVSLDPGASLVADTYTFGAGRVSLMLDPSLAIPSDNSLVLDNDFLARFGAASSVGLLSYSSIDLHGAGQFGSSSLKNLTLGAAEIRGIGQGSGTASIVARDVLLQNLNASAAGTPASASGSLEITAQTIRLGENQVALNQYANVRLAATRGILGEGTGGLSSQAKLVLDTPRLTGAAGAVRTITAGGDLILTSTTATPSGGLVAGGSGSTLTLTGASIAAGSEVLLESGNLSLRATTGDLKLTGKLDVSGGRKVFGDTIRYSSAGNIRLTAEAGNVIVDDLATLDLAAHPGGGNAGSLSVANPAGTFTLAGTLLGSGGTGGNNGSFSLDTSVLPSLSTLATRLRQSSFTGTQEFRVRKDDVTLDGLSVARDFLLSADQGDVTVTGTVDASGATGGSIRIVANGDLVLASGSKLDASGDDFSNAGKGGAITLEAGASRDGVAGPGSLGLLAGSAIDLSVASNNASSASLGKFTGKLHLRAPQLGGDVEVDALDSTITGASSILVEGYRIYDLSSTTGTITSAIQNQIRTDGESFLGTAGTSSAAYTTIANRLLENNPGLASILVLAPGAEVIHRTGNLTLGTTTSTNTSDWNLASYRFGEKSAPGVLTLRAAGNITLHNAISDGFVSSAYNSLLLPDNALLPVNTRSYSYRFVSGADFGAADFGATQALGSLAANSGSLLLGKNNTNNFSNSNGSNNNPGTNATTALALNNRYQLIRTGTGDIDIRAGRSVQLLNHFATIYTAGTVIADPTLGGNFDLPVLNQSGGNITLGAIQQNPSYPAQYTMAGGNVSIAAGLDIEHVSRTNQNVLIADSQRQLPNNWLYRRGYVDATGKFGTSQGGDVASTTWWVDFSNFFQGIGALGGGDVTLSAGNNVNNVDAVIPTNARMPKGTPNAANLVEIGGGDLIVRAGNNIDAGVYYVERGRGTLDAGGSIVTNSTRSPSIPQLTGSGNILDSHTWLPTTLFLGKGRFDVTALGDLLLGPVANPFLLPPGINNTFWQKSYFSTYGPDSSVHVSSVGGAVTLRQGTTLPAGGAGSVTSMLQAWVDRQQVLRSTNPVSASFYQPWLRLAETSATPFSTVLSLLPPTLDVTSFTSDINLVGNVTLFPSATGNLGLLAGGAINGLQPNGRVTFNGTSTSWGSSRINVSDADPNAIPDIANPFGYTALVGYDLTQARSTRGGFLEFVNRLFRETGATQGAEAILQVKQALHAAGLLHKDDDEPVRLYAGEGDISGLTLFSPKAALVYAARDIADVALYLQNVRAGDTSVVAAGRDIIPSNANSLLRLLARANGNVVNNDSPANLGDIQIAGPGTLQVLAGRNLDLGTGAELPDGTSAGISSIGNARNSYLPGAGANLIVGAGVRDAVSLADSGLDFATFITQYVSTAEGADYLKELAPGVDFASLGEEEQARLALGVFYLILRDAGRDYAVNGNYDSALAAIDVLLGDGDPQPGDILTRGRSIRTTRGGAINLLTPGGGLTLANTAIGNPQSPPGIITESGGDIFTFANNDVNIGIGRIFTLRGGNQIIWSTTGDIAAGSSSKTVTSAPPTRVLIDPQSAAVQTDLAGLATGGGIGALATVAGVPLGDVDLVAPEGTVDAGDAGIRVSGNLNIAAQQVLNAGNIAAGGTSTGTPTAPSAPSVSTATNAATAAAAAGESATTPQSAPQQPGPEPVIEEVEAVVSVEVLGYEDDEEEEDEDEAAGEEGASE